MVLKRPYIAYCHFMAYFITRIFPSICSQFFRKKIFLYFPSWH